MAKSSYSTAMDHEHFGMNQAEMNTIDCLIEGKIISNLAFPRVDERVKRIFTYLSKLTLFVAKVVFQYYHFSKQFLPNLSEILKIFGFFHNILLCCKSCQNGYSDKLHCLPKICPI